jgi:heptosyltransferase II
MNLRAEEIERVVVRGANWVGDAVLTVPALRELRRVLPRAHVTLATRPWAEGVFDGADFIDELLPAKPGGGVGSFFRQVRQWRARRFDLAVLFPNAFEPALLAAAARVPARVGYRTDGRGPLLTHPLDAPEWRARRHEVFYYFEIVRRLESILKQSDERSERAGSDESGESDESDEGDARGLRPELPLSDERRASARALLRAEGLSLARPLVAICPGSTNSRAKRWPAERYAALADLLVEEAGAEVVIVGAREESDVTREVVARMRHTAAVLTGRTSLAETAAVLGTADLLVTNDTGPAHVAAALGRPVLVVFGPTNPATTRPYSDLAEIVRRPPDCAPCMLRDCPIDHRCMTAVSPGEVFARAAAMLARAGAAGGALAVAGREGAAR